MAVKFSPEAHFGFIDTLKEKTEGGVDPNRTNFFRADLDKATPVGSLLRFHFKRADDQATTRTQKKAFAAYIRVSLEKRGSRDFFDKTLWGSDLSDHGRLQAAAYLDALLLNILPLIEFAAPDSSPFVSSDIQSYLAALTEYRGFLPDEKKPAADHLGELIGQLEDHFSDGNFDAASQVAHQIILLVGPSG